MDFKHVQPGNLEDQLRTILLLLPAGADSGALESAIQRAFALVPQRNEPHRNEFLPTFAIRYIAQDNLFAELDGAARLKLHNQASTAMLDWLESATMDKSHPKRSCLASSVPLQFYPAARECLSELRALDPEQELCFRLIQIAGNSLEETRDLLTLPLEEVTGRWLAARAFVEDRLEFRDESLSLLLFDEAGLRPPAEVTRVLENIRKRNGTLWEVTESQEGLRQLQNTARGVVQRVQDVDSIVQESMLRMALPSGPIPENSRRLQQYAFRIMRNLVHDRYRKESKLVHPDDDLIDQTLQAAKPHPDEDARRNTFIEVLTKILVQLDLDQPNVSHALETLDSMPNATDAERAAHLGISVATFKRHKDKGQAYLEAAFEKVGLDLGHYKNYSRSQRFENLYQLIYPILTGEMRLTKGGDYRAELSAALDVMSLDSPSFYSVLHESYLGPSVKPQALAARLKITPAELARKKLEAKTGLAKEIASLIQDKP